MPPNGVHRANSPIHHVIGVSPPSLPASDIRRRRLTASQPHGSHHRTPQVPRRKRFRWSVVHLMTDVDTARCTRDARTRFVS